MTVGEKIQFYRKNSGMSQEELGQKLMLSRQTVSLWENGQTIPTIDNLMRLREIFSVSVDEILGISGKQEDTVPLPNEIYTFNFTQSELNALRKFLGKGTVIQSTVYFLITALFLFAAFWMQAPDLLIGCFIGVAFITIPLFIIKIVKFKKAWKSNESRIRETTYEYKIYEDHFTIFLYKGNEKVRESKHEFSAIEQVIDADAVHFFIVTIGGQIFILKKDLLPKDSFFFTCLKEKAQKKQPKAMDKKQHTISVALSALSILSLFFSFFLIETISRHSANSIQHAFVPFLFIPIPLACAIYGIVMKRKQYKSKTNIVIGIVMTVLLVIYGSFSFIFNDTYDHSDKPIIRLEEMMQIELPEYENITTIDWSDENQGQYDDRIFSTSDIRLNQDTAQTFEVSLDEKWIKGAPIKLFPILSAHSEIILENYTYILVYNMDTNEFNTLPQDEAPHRYINILFNTEDNTLTVIEYEKSLNSN